MKEEKVINYLVWGGINSSEIGKENYQQEREAKVKVKQEKTVLCIISTAILQR